jgi:hypothetical protein
MEPPPGARLVDGWWTWRPAREPLPGVKLTHSSFAGDYQLCRKARCSALSDLAGPAGEGEAINLAPCSSGAR